MTRKRQMGLDQCIWLRGLDHLKRNRPQRRPVVWGVEDQRSGYLPALDSSTESLLYATLSGRCFGWSVILHWPSEQLLQEYYYIINAFRKTDIPWTAIMLNSSNSKSNFLFILQTLPLLPPQITMLLTMHLQRIATQITLLDWYFLCTQLFRGMLVCCFLLSLVAWLKRAQHENQNSTLVSFINWLCYLKT